MHGSVFSPQKPVNRYVQNVGQSDQFKIRYITNLPLQLGQAGSIHVNAVHLKLSQSLLLLHALIFPCQFNPGSNQISGPESLLAQSHGHPSTSFSSISLREVFQLLIQTAEYTGRQIFYLL